MSIPIRQGLVPALIVLLGLVCAAPARAQYISVSVDGQPLSFSQPPVVSNGHLLVPLRGIFEHLGATVQYNAADRSITAMRGATTVHLTIGSSLAQVNGNSVTLETPAQEINGRTLVPLRFVSEAMGAQVTWNASTRSVAISSANLPPSTSIGPPPSATAPPPGPAPTISNVYTNGLQALAPGDRLTVEADGTPGSTATFDLLGITSNQPMSETSPGHFVGTLTISNQMQPGSATVVVHMTHNGQTASLPASNPVTIGYGTSTYPTYPTPTVPPTAGTLQPAPGSVVNVTRPSIMAQVSNNLAPGSVRLIVDGQDVTGAARITANQISYVPTYDLGVGTHTVQVVGRDAYGYPINQNWSFTVPAGAVSGTYGPTYPANPGTLYVTVNSPQAGQRIDGNFTVTGNTLPYATVLVTANVKRSLIPGIINLNSRTVTAEGQADASGAYSILVPVGSVPHNGDVSLNVRATDQYGNSSQPVQFDIATGP